MLNKAVCERVILSCVSAFDRTRFQTPLTYLLQGFSVVLCSLVILEIMANARYLCNWKKWKPTQMANMLIRNSYVHCPLQQGGTNVHIEKNLETEIFRLQSIRSFNWPPSLRYLIHLHKKFVLYTYAVFHKFIEFRSNYTANYYHELLIIVLAW